MLGFGDDLDDIDFSEFAEFGEPSRAELELIRSADRALRQEGFEVDFDPNDSNKLPALNDTPEPSEPTISTGSKKARAITIYRQSASRKDAIARFKSELGMTPGGASNYYQRCKKEWCK